MREIVANKLNNLIEGLAELDSSNDLHASTIRRKEKVVQLHTLAVELKVMLFSEGEDAAASEPAPQPEDTTLVTAEEYLKAMGLNRPPQPNPPGESSV